MLSYKVLKTNDPNCTLKLNCMHLYCNTKCYRVTRHQCNSGNIWEGEQVERPQVSDNLLFDNKAVVDRKIVVRHYFTLTEVSRECEILQ